MNEQFWLAFGLYFTIILSIGWIASKKNATASEMLVGGRGLNYWVTALSAHASDMSSWLFMSFPMSLMLGGFPKIWIAVSLLLGMFASWHFIAPKLRVETERYNASTLPTYLARRYNDTKGTIRFISSALSLIFLTYYLAAGLISVGLLFETLFQKDYMIGVISAALLITVYTFIGGFVSVAWVDLFQALFLLVAIVIVPLLAFIKIDGLQAIQQAAEHANISLSFLPENFTGFCIVLFGWGLGYLGMPHIVNKFMGIKNPKELVKSKYLGMSWELLALGGAAAVGLIGIAYFKQGIENPELVFIYMVKELFHPFASGLVLCGVLAATISTMDSQLLVAASTLTEDIYKPLQKNQMGSKREVQVFRAAVILITLIALWIASYRNRTIMDTVYYAWAGLGCTFAPLVTASLYSQKVTRQGAIAGIIAGGGFAALYPPTDGITMIPGFLLGIIALFTVSKLTKHKDC
jgi:SSS family solute:Na+ symporter